MAEIQGENLVLVVFEKGEGMYIRGRTILGVLIFMGAILWAIMLGESAMIFVDAPSLIIIFMCITGGVLARHSLDDIASVSDDVIKTMIVSSIGGGVISALIGCVQFLAFSTDSTYVKVVMAVNLLSVLYGIGFALIFYFVKSNIKTNRIVAVSFMIIPLVSLAFYCWQYFPKS